MQAAAIWEQAMPADEYVAQMSTNRDAFLENMRRTEITAADRVRFGAQPLKLLVLTEEWCNDSVQFLAAALRLAHEVPGVAVRVLRRDEHRELAAQYPRSDGYNAIPIFILFDEDARELGALVERPARVTAEMAEETRRFQQEHPELPGIRRNVDHMPDETKALVKANNARWRVDKLERWVPYLFDDLAAIAERARAEQAAQARP
ncbi:MAG TPA: thioredoxin family protein [Thermomicrobiaceae bacterium]|nr:thioredoxin family protein [Thermomicrobiaceae bacterium]